MNSSESQPTSHASVRESFSEWCARIAPVVTRLAIALIYLWFGALKLLGVSPAEPLIRATFYFLPGDPVIVGLGVWEVAIAALLLSRRTVRWGLLLLALHLPGTFLSYVTASEMCFSSPFVLTDLGEFVLKNLMVIGAVIFLAGHYGSARVTRVS